MSGGRARASGEARPVVRGATVRGPIRKDEGAMRPWIRGLAATGLAGACVLALGCGGGGVPDPGSDSSAASDAPAEGGAPPAPAVAAAPEPAPAPAQALAPRGRGPAAAPGTGDAANEKEEPAAQAASEENAAPAKTEGNSATAEMLAMATGSQSGSGGGARPGQVAEPARRSSGRHRVLRGAWPDGPGGNSGGPDTRMGGSGGGRRLDAEQSGHGEMMARRRRAGSGRCLRPDIPASPGRAREAGPARQARLRWRAWDDSRPGPGRSERR